MYSLRSSNDKLCFLFLTVGGLLGHEFYALHTTSDGMEFLQPILYRKLAEIEILKGIILPDF